MMSSSSSIASRSQTTTRSIRTEVIWKREDDDPYEKCPINVNCHHISRRRKTALSACLALVVVTAQHLLSSKIRQVSMVAENVRPGSREEAESLAPGRRPTGVVDERDGGIDRLMDVFPRGARVALPPLIDESLADVDERLGAGDVPYFFHVPRAMGETIKDILGDCGDLNATNLTTTIEGILAARRHGMVERGMIDVAITQYFHAGATLFNERHRGRMFTIIRHPIERAVSMFHYLPKAIHEMTYDPDLAHISIEMWAKSKRIEHNWMTRFLSNELEGNLTAQHLDVSKEILRKKCIVGLLDEKTESWLRLERFFGWRFRGTRGKDRECVDRQLNWGWSNKNLHPAVEEGSTAWDLLYKQNELDMMLYHYAHILFEEQRALFGEGGRLVD